MLRFKELDGVRDSVKVRLVTWDSYYYIYWTGTVFLDKDREIYDIPMGEIMTGIWEYYIEPEPEPAPELFCPICGAEAELLIGKKFGGTDRSIRCIDDCVGICWYTTTKRAIEAWRAIGGVK